MLLTIVLSHVWETGGYFWWKEFTKTPFGKQESKGIGITAQIVLAQCVRKTEYGAFIVVLEITRIVFKINLGAFGEGIPLRKDLDMK